MHPFCRKHPPFCRKWHQKSHVNRLCWTKFQILKIVREKFENFCVQRKIILSQARSYQILTKMSTRRNTFQKIFGLRYLILPALRDNSQFFLSGVLLFTIIPALRVMSLSAQSSGEPHPLSALCSLSLRVSPPIHLYKNFCIVTNNFQAYQ